MSEDELFTTKTDLQMTEVGSPNIDPYLLNLESEDFLKKFSIDSKNALTSLDNKLKKRELRRIKVENYLNKKHSRCFTKKIYYHSRKVIAQSRLRIKGKFVTKAQAE
jgi:hypothetical protein